MTVKDKILIIRTDRIGDVVLTLPVAEILKKERGAEVWFMGRDYTQVLVDASPYVDGFLSWDDLKNKGVLQSAAELRKHNFSEVYIISPNFRVSLICLLSGIEKRVGTGYRWYSFLFSQKIFEHRKTAEKHELEYNLSMVGWRGKYSFPADFFAGIKENKNSQTDNSKIITIVHPGSGGSAADLPETHFSFITEKLCEDGRFQVFLTGSKDEIEKCMRVRGTSEATLLAGELSLSELTAFIKEGDLFISNSTGPLHIAAASGCFIVGFYPKVIQCSAKRWGPYTERKLIYEPEMDCNGCDLKQCVRLECMNSINSEKIVADIMNKIQEIKKWNSR